MIAKWPGARLIWMNPLVWTGAAFVALVVGMPALRPLFAALFPYLDRPLYTQESFLALATAHVMLVAASSAISVVLGVGAGVFVTRPIGADFRGLIETLVAIGQTFPPVAVLAMAVPVIGFGFWPALIALALYGLLPIVENTIAGLEAVPAAIRETGRGLGMSSIGLLWRVELPLAAPVIVAGIRTSVIINIGTATIASTVGATTLGTPIILGLSGSNVAYVLQGAIVVGLLAIVVDIGFEQLTARLQRWKQA